MNAADARAVIMDARNDKPSRLDLYVCTAVAAAAPIPLSGAEAVDIALGFIEEVEEACRRVERGEPLVVAKFPGADASETKLGEIRSALADYRTALKNRQHAGLAAHTFVDAVAAILGESATP